MSTATLLREAAQIQSSLMSQIGRNVYVLTSLPRVGKKILLKLYRENTFWSKKHQMAYLMNCWFGVLLSLVGVVGDNRSDEGVAIAAVQPPRAPLLVWTTRF